MARGGMLGASMLWEEPMPGLYAFDRCEIRPGERQLLIDGAPAALGARASRSPAGLAFKA